MTKLSPAKIRNRLLAAKYRKSIPGLSGFVCSQEPGRKDVVLVSHYIAFSSGDIQKDRLLRQREQQKYANTLTAAGFVVTAVNDSLQITAAQETANHE